MPSALSSRRRKEYVFKVSLRDSKHVSRTIALRGDQTLDDLHQAIFAAFDRFDAHLYSFYFPKAPTRRATAEPTPKEYTASQLFDEPEPCDDESRFDAAATKLDDLGLKPGERFEYLFDFGDCWWHDIAVEAVSPSVPRARYPEIRESHGASPPQYEAQDE